MVPTQKHKKELSVSVPHVVHKSAEFNKYRIAPLRSLKRIAE